MKFLSLQLGNTAGVPWRIAQALSQSGFPSLVVGLEPQAEGYPTDIELHMTRDVSFPLRAIHFARIARLARATRVVHFHFGFPAFARRLRSLCRAPFFVHYHGSDLREGIADGFRQLAAREFVATPDLKKLAPHALWVPNPYPVPDLQMSKPNPRTVVGHFPSNPSKKGTGHILRVIASLRGRKDFEFQMSTGISHVEAMRQMSRCDIIIDQLTPFGVYGMVAVEAMALGKVVISSVDRRLYDRCPIVPASPTNFEDRLQDLLDRKDEWSGLGMAGRQYVERVHNPVSVAALLVHEYERHL